MTVPINNATVPAGFNPTAATFEIWFKSDNMLSLNQEVILGLSPYKFRKKAGIAQINLVWGDITYCDSTNLLSNQWNHFAVSMNEADASLHCYINGAALSTGLIPVSAITADIVAPSEITFGGSTTLKPSET